MPSAKYGEEVMAWVELQPGASASTAEELTAFCSGRIATLQGPALLEDRRTSFPMTVTGKVQKYKMREQAIEELGLAAAAAVRTA